MLMNKTIKQAERYEAPKSMVVTIAVQKVIAQSPDPYNPEATGEDFNPSVE